MFSQCHSFAPAKISFKISFLPPRNIQYSSTPSRIICCALNEDDVPSTFNVPGSIGSLPYTPDRALSSPFIEGRGRKSVPFSFSTATASSIESETTNITPNTFMESTLSKGIGILNFLEGKSYCITGATGLLAKAFVEKILRVAPNTRKIFLLIKARNEEEALSIIKTEIVECEIFKRLKEMHGEGYEDFMMSKLVSVVGNMAEPNLGISNPELETQMADEVDMIVNSAATTNFEERYDVALNVNTQGPFRLLIFAKKCKKLRLLMHVSTAYVNGERQGIVREKPILMGESIAEEMASAFREDQSFELPKLDVHGEIKLASDMVKSLHEDDAARKTMKELGMARAKMFGWQNTYVFTKAMGEMMLGSYKSNIPVTIIRPSIIESTYAEPFPGWIQGNRMVDPLLLSYGKGVLPGYLSNPNAPVDIVPADMVVNTMVSAMAKHGISSVSELNLYQVSSSVTNPLTYREMFDFSFEHYALYPLMKDSRGDKVMGIERMKFFSSLLEFSAYIRVEIAKKLGLTDCDAASNPKGFQKLKVMWRKTSESLIYMAKIHEPFTFYKGWFDNGNTQKLMAEMSEEELGMFPLDLKSIDWKHYFVNIHIHGLKRHVIKVR